MSSIRINPHSRPAAASSPASEAGRPDASPADGSFAVALGAAALMRQAAAGAPFGAKPDDAADGATTTRKRPGDGKGADDAAALAAQGSLLAAGQLLPVPHNPADPGAGSGGDQLAEDAVLSSAAASGAAGTGLSRPSAALTPTAQDDPGNALAMGDGTEGATAGAIPADAMAETSALLSNLGPTLQTAPNSASAPVSPAVAASLASAQLLTGATQAGTGAGDPGTGAGSEGRFRFAPAAAANDGSRATAAAALGAPETTPALANTPSLAVTPATVVDSSEAPTVSAQVSAHVLGMVAGQSREMIMRLHPPELGEVTVRVAVSGRDVSAWFGSPHGQVQTAIAGGIGQLQAELGNAGYNLNGAWVGADASGARQQGANLSSPATSIAPATAVDPSGMTAASRPAASGLNIYV